MTIDTKTARRLVIFGPQLGFTTRVGRQEVRGTDRRATLGQTSRHEAGPAGQQAQFTVLVVSSGFAASGAAATTWPGGPTTSSVPATRTARAEHHSVRHKGGINAANYRNDGDNVAVLRHGEGRRLPGAWSQTMVPAGATASSTSVAAGRAVRPQCSGYMITARLAARRYPRTFYARGTPDPSQRLL